MQQAKAKGSHSSNLDITWRLICSSFLVMTYFLVRASINMLP